MGTGVSVPDGVNERVPVDESDELELSDSEVEEELEVEKLSVALRDRDFESLKLRVAVSEKVGVILLTVFSADSVRDLVVVGFVLESEAEDDIVIVVV